MIGVAQRTRPMWVVGAGGMLAGELMRLVSEHPVFDLAGAVTREGGEALGELHPHLGGAIQCTTIEALVEGLGANEEPGWLVLALPHGEAAATWSALRASLGPRAESLRVVDLSADHRLEDTAAYERWYGAPHPDPGELARFTYALPELARGSLEGATRLAAPGCFATALQLACAPAAAAGFLSLDAPWVVHAVTGSSGSGAKPRPLTHHPFRHGNYRSYARDGHRHEAELAQAIGVAPPLVFLPHSGPWSRGIHLSAVLPLRSRIDPARARAAYGRAFASRPFVYLLDGGGPDLRRVVGSNTAAVGLGVRGDSLLVEVTLDNLIKGGSGQALQAMNLAEGLPETLGLPKYGMGTL